MEIEEKTLMNFQNWAKRLIFSFADILTIFGIVFIFAACDEECCADPIPEPEVYPSLKVENQNTDSRVIISVNLVGYEFNSLSIPIGESQTFDLDKGLPGGYSDINVNVAFNTSTRPSETLGIKVNFKDGETTTITLKGCVSAEGCDGFYLE
jgi:hypothetical protein